MSFRLFVFFLIAGAFVSITLLAAKVLLPKWKTYVDGDHYVGADACRTWSGRLSWFAIPFPFLLGAALAAHQFIYWSLVYHSMDGRW